MDRDSNDLVQHTWVYNFSLRCFGTVYLPALDRRVEADLLANEVQSCHLNMKSTVQRPSLHPSRRLSGTEKGSTGNPCRAANLEGRPRVVLMLLALQSQLDVQTLELCCCSVLDRLIKCWSELCHLFCCKSFCEDLAQFSIILTG